MIGVVIDFILYSLLEAYISCMFFERMGKFKIFQIHEIILIGIGNCIISQIFPPVIYQLLILLFMGIFLHTREKNISIKKCLLFSMGILLFTLVIEMPFAMFYDMVLNIDFSKVNVFHNFMAMIPIRIVEIILILIGGRNMIKTDKFWFGEITKPKK